MTSFDSKMVKFLMWFIAIGVTITGSIGGMIMHSQENLKTNVIRDLNQMDRKLFILHISDSLQNNEIQYIKREMINFVEFKKRELP